MLMKFVRPRYRCEIDVLATCSPSQITSAAIVDIASWLIWHPVDCGYGCGRMTLLKTLPMYS